MNTLGFGICSLEISRLNWKSTAKMSVARKSAWLFSDLEYNLQVCGHSIAFGSIFFIDMTHDKFELYHTSSSVTPIVVAVLRPAMITSYSASLLLAWNPSV